MSSWHRLIKLSAAAMTVVLIVVAAVAGFRLRGDFLLTADQRGQRLLEREEFDAAAQVFEDPFRRAVALSLAGDFKRSASLFSTIPGPEAAYNQANMLVMQGNYESAVSRYDRALALKPDWLPAVTNRAIAAGRAARLITVGGEMTGGKLGADEIVFDQSSSPSNSSKDNEETVVGDTLSDSELQAIWLRQVQTTPREFLKSKFAFQEAMRDKEPSNEE